MTATRVALAGSTGSIGTQTLDVVAAEPERFEVVAIGATGRDPQVLVEQARAVRPRIVAVSDPSAAAVIAEALPQCEVRGGPEAMASLAADADVVVNGVVGFAGLGVTLATLRAGRRLALANKESLIAAGPVVQQARRTPGAELVPVDSEHGALHQCLRANDDPRRVARLLLTASGGPFRGRSADDLAAVTVDEALAHPTWSMGPKITVDSSTLMNKGLEVIEAHELFGAPAGDAGVGLGYDQIDVVVHPQSIVHSMVEFTDASTIAQLSAPDMRLPIGYALAWPDRIATPFGRIDWTTLGRLDFEPPDRAAFGCLDLAYAAGRRGGTAPAWLNAANEVAVEAFLAGRIRWADIAAVIASTLDHHDDAPATDADAVVDADRTARRVATDLLDRSPLDVTGARS
ncbi:1-deoxy-D-xylulose-5-phosphate reductoisomerase [Rhabdothermincola salaria]|uniref:1-deoxy-D-xylulose-5-phosphate reductoisomerase n=1 Tax=Rhabdothermincola salaria TaxID=2903142 RepID=UPI001E5341B4|nr:1-deoxy-D-xylulose-5-phosphate reductoisomerase [Rhabdothermincola salaria]MCD9624923.1 1-deoxy-D-xylulose-5-phosphate reductoisomerase [Rhabdothermincola salaria]